MSIPIFVNLGIHFSTHRIFKGVAEIEVLAVVHGEALVDPAFVVFTEYPYTYTVVKLREPIIKLG